METKNRVSGQTWFEELEEPEPPLPTPASLKASAAPDHSILRSRHPDMDMASSIKLSPSLVPLKLKCLKLLYWGYTPLNWCGNILTLPLHLIDSHRTTFEKSASGRFFYFSMLRYISCFPCCQEGFFNVRKQLFGDQFRFTWELD